MNEGEGASGIAGAPKRFMRNINRVVEWRPIAWASIFLILFAAALAAQYRAGLQGVITDASGAGVPGASVTLTSKETNIKRTTKSNDTGGYAIPGLPPGDYTLTVEKTGFSKKVLENVLIAGEEVQSLN